MTFAMTTFESLGWASQFGTVPETADYYNAGGDPGAATQRFLIDSGGLTAKKTILERDALRGNRSSVANDTRTGPYTVSGTIVMRPTPEDLAIWLPRILGGSSSTPFTVGNVLPQFVVWQDLIAKVFSYRGCKVDKATFSFRKGDFMRMSLDIVGATEVVGTGGTFASLTPSVTTPFIICDTVLTMISVARAFDDAELVINNNLVKDNFKNSCTIVALDEGPRHITLKTSMAFNLTYIDLYNIALAGATGATLAATLGNYSQTLTFGSLQIPAETPMNKGKGDIPLVLDMVARKIGTTPGTTDEISWALDSTG